MTLPLSHHFVSFYASEKSALPTKTQNFYSNIDFLFTRVTFVCYRDLHLDDVRDVTMLSNTKFLVKRATEAIKQMDADAKETKYEFS